METGATSPQLSKIRKQRQNPYNDNINFYFSLGVQFYNKGLYVRSFNSFINGAKQGCRKCQYRVSVHYWKGRGVKTNPEKEVFWLKKSAAQNYLPAIYNLGIAFITGAGVPKDDEAAASWFTIGANLGHANCHGQLGICYQKGHGVSKDLQMAIYHVEQAVAKGASNYNRYLTQLKLMIQEEETKLYLDPNSCRICFLLPRDSVFYPCGHIASCFSCGSKLETCPVCRLPCNVIKTYFA